MDKKYRELFTLIAQNTANLAEQVMEEHKKKGEDKGYNTAEAMRNEYLNLYDKLKSDEALTRPDYARVLIGTIVVTNQLDARIKNEQKVLQMYKIDLIPKLDQINTADEDKALQLADELFQQLKEDENE